MTIKHEGLGAAIYTSYTLEAEDVVTKGTTIGAQDPIELFKLSPGWEVFDVGVETLVDMNGTGTRVLDVGVDGTANAIANDVDLDGTGHESVTVTKFRATASIGVTVTLVTGTANPTAGKFRIVFGLRQVMREN